MDISPNRPFHLRCTNFSNREEQLPIHMTIAQTAEPPGIIHAIEIDDWDSFPTQTVNGSTDSEFYAHDGTAIRQASHQADISAVH